MSNKMKGAKIHPNNKLSNIEIAFNALVKGAKRSAARYGNSKHVGSKSVKTIQHTYFK